MMRFGKKHLENSNEGGFTLLEVLVAMTLNSAVLAMVVLAATSNRQHYLEDAVRTKVAGNLRSALDVMSMNVRQAGENLSGSFPSIELIEASGLDSDILKVRRSILPEILTICDVASTGDTQILVSLNTSTKSQCAPGNVAPAHATWSAHRTAEGGSIRAYIFNSLTKQGEFVDYTSEAFSLGDYLLNVSALENDYPVHSSYVYILEEFAFQHDSLLETLTLFEDGETDVPKTIAFSIAEYDVILEMQDGSEQFSMLPGGTTNWKDVRMVRIELTGEQTRAGRTFTFSEVARIFPRNIMSY